MALRDPVAVYNAASNVEAHLVRNVLLQSGVQAYVTEDVSQVGTWMFGLLPEIHKPQVWIDTADIDRAQPILEDYERRAAERRGADDGAGMEPPIEVTCEACGRCSLFSRTQRGSVQDCPHCGAYVDVEGDEVMDAWPQRPGEQTEG